MRVLIIGGIVTAALASPLAAQERSKDDEATVRTGMPTETQCVARARAWSRHVPQGAQVTKDMLAAAIGPDCDADAILARMSETERVRQEMLDDCRGRFEAGGGDPAKRYDVNSARARNELWLDIARAAGSDCADLIVGQIGGRR